MKKITLSADEGAIRRARLVAKARHTTLNALFREWLEDLTARDRAADEFGRLMQRLKHVRSNGPYAREEMNER